MQNLKILNSKETKHIFEKLEAQYGYTADRQKLDFIFLMNKDNRLYIVSKDIAKIDFENLKIDAIGVYFGELYNESIRLSLEGAQVIGKGATKNIIYITDDDMLEWVKGKDIKHEDCGKDFVIILNKNKITCHDDILGCGKYKDGNIVNYVSKSRRLVVVNY